MLSYEITGRRYTTTVDSFCGVPRVILMFNDLLFLNTYVYVLTYYHMYNKNLLLFFSKKKKITRRSSKPVVKKLKYNHLN